MACECNNVMVSVAVILFIALVAQILSFGLPGWTRWSPKNSVSRNKTVIFKEDKTYTSGLWVECEDGIQNCDDWLQRSLDMAKDVSMCTGDRIQGMVSGRKLDCRDYNNVDLAMWVTQALGLSLLALAFLSAVLSSLAYCCGGCCGDYCVAFCKFFVLLVCMLAALCITSGLLLFGIHHAEEKYRLEVIREGLTFAVNKLQLYYSYGLAAFAAILALLATIIGAFSKTHDGKI